MLLTRLWLTPGLSQAAWVQGANSCLLTRFSFMTETEILSSLRLKE